MMSKQDYVLTAQAFADTKPTEGGTMTYSDLCVARYELVMLAKDLATRLREQNPRFDRERFLAACGVQP